MSLEYWTLPWRVRVNHFNHSPAHNGETETFASQWQRGRPRQTQERRVALSVGVWMKNTKAPWCTAGLFN